MKTPKSDVREEAMAGKCKKVVRRLRAWNIREESGDPSSLLDLTSRSIKDMNRLILSCRATRSGRLLEALRARESIIYASSRESRSEPASCFIVESNISAILIWLDRPLGWPLRGEARGLGDGDGLRIPLTGLDEAEGVVIGDDLKNLDASRYSVWLDHSTFFLIRLELELVLVAPFDDGVLAPGGVWRLSLGSMGRPTEAFIGAILSGKDSRGGVGGRGESSSRVVALAEDAMAARQRWRSRQQ